MEQKERLFGVLQALATSSCRALTPTALMYKARYKTRQALREDLKKLEEDGLIVMQRSGFPSDSNRHRKIVVLSTDVIWVNPREYEEYQPSTPNTPPLCVTSFPTSSQKGLTQMPQLKKITPLIHRFFQLIYRRHFKKAEKTQQLINKNLPKKDFYGGFALALNGILVAKRERDDDAYVNNINAKKIPRDIRDFKNRLTTLTTTQYDQGYFYAMIQYLKFIRKTRRVAEERKEES